MNFSEHVDAANQHLTHPLRNKVINGKGTKAPRFELYHSAPSLCSMKCRTVMAEKGIPYHSHDMNIRISKGMAENYLPDYVRLRMLGAPGARLANSYTGQSSVTTEGFDPCVVPTLVDHEKEAVIVDSSRICLYLDQETGGELTPSALSNEIGTQIDVVDQAPHVAALYGAHPDHDPRPLSISKPIQGVHAKKIEKLETVMAAVVEEPQLVAAYEAKIAKEAAAGQFVYDADEMRAAHRAMHDHVGLLNSQLERSDGPWVMGTTYSLADIIWSVSLYRMQWLGMGAAWIGKFPRVEAYAAKAFQRPAFQAGVIEWPAVYGPSPHVPEFSGFGPAVKFFYQIFKRG